VGSCKHDSEPLGSHKGQLLNQLSDPKLLKRTLLYGVGELVSLLYLHRQHKLRTSRPERL
jgi:hypothetical protein